MATIYNSIVPNKIKIDYTSNGFKDDLHYDSNYLNINTWYFGIDVNKPYYPSSGTGWYQGIDAKTIDDLTYTIYYTGTTIGRTGNSNDKYRCVQYTDQQGVIDFVDPFVVGTPTFENALDWFKDDADTKPKGGNGFAVCVNMNYPNIPTSGLTFALDAGHVASYPWTSSTWYDFTQSAMSGFSGNSTIIGQFNNSALFFEFLNNGDPFEFFTNTTYNKSLGGNFTIIFWARPAYGVASNWQAVFSCSPTISSSFYNQSVGFYNNGVGDINFYYDITDSSGGSKTRIGTATIDNTMFHQYAYVFENKGSNSEISFYIDGTLSETNSESFLAANWSPSSPNWTIGQVSRVPNINNNFLGRLQILLVYDRVLSGTEIADIYQNYYDTRSIFT